MLIEVKCTTIQGCAFKTQLTIEDLPPQRQHLLIPSADAPDIIRHHKDTAVHTNSTDGKKIIGHARYAVFDQDEKFLGNITCHGTGVLFEKDQEYKYRYQGG